jgi:hypothetical protein
VREEYKESKYDPTRECTNTTREALLIQKKADGERADDLCNPINEVIQATGTDVKQSTVVVIEFCDFWVNNVGKY